MDSTPADKKTVLVTGGGGFIGSHTCVALLNSNYNVVAIDNGVNCYKDDRLGHPESLIRAQILTGKRLDFRTVDLLEADKLKKVLQDVVKEHGKIDAVIHFAALKAVGESCAQPLRYYKNNVGGTINLIEAMESIGATKFIFSSSATVYGDPATLPITESSPTGVGLTNPYGKSKFFTEEILRDHCTAQPDWTVVTLRYFNPVGAHKSGIIGEDPNGIPNNLVPFVAQVALGRLAQLQVFGNDWPTKDGTGVRDYIHIEDLVDGHVAALTALFAESKPLKGFVAYNLGTGEGHSVLDVVRTFSAVSERQIPYQVVGRRPGDIAVSYCDATLAFQDLKWFAKRSLAEMCKDVWRWQSQNPNGYARPIAADCLLHSPNRLTVLLDAVTQSSLAAIEHSLHSKFIQRAEEIKVAQGIEALRQLKDGLKAAELLKLAAGQGLCAQEAVSIPFCSCCDAQRR